MLQASIQQVNNTAIVDLFPTGDAVSAGAGEANSVTGWTPNGGSATKASIASTDPGGGGTYALECGCLNAGFRAVSYDVSGLSLVPHTATIRTRRTDGTGGVLGWSNVSSVTYSVDYNSNGTDWFEGTVTFTPTTGTITIRFYPCDNDGSTSGTIEVSEITITEN